MTIVRISDMRSVRVKRKRASVVEVEVGPVSPSPLSEPLNSRGSIWTTELEVTRAAVGATQRAKAECETELYRPFEVEWRAEELARVSAHPSPSSRQIPRKDEIKAQSY